MWLKKIAEFFKSPEEKQEEIIDFLELRKWLAPRLDMGIAADFVEIGRIKADMEKAIEALEKVDVMPLKVEEKLKDFVRGNRNAYVISLRSFMGKLKAPEAFDSGSVAEFCTTFDREIADFSRKTMKNYYIMKQLIGKELEAIAKCLKKVEVLTNDIGRKLKDGRLEKMEDVMRKLNGIYSHVDEKGEREKKLVELERQRDLLAEKEEKLEKEAKALENGKEFSEYTALKAKTEELGKKQYDLKNGIAMRFSEISRVLRKHAKLQPNKLIDNYLEDAYEAVMHDSHLAIAGILEALNAELKEGKIEEKDSKKLQQTVSAIDKAYFERLRDDSKKLSDELRDCEERLAKNKFEKDRDSLIAEMGKAEKELSETEEKVRGMKNRAIGNEVKAIQEDLKALGFSVKVANAPLD